MLDCSRLRLRVRRLAMPLSLMISLSGCASGIAIAPQASLRDATSLGLTEAPNAVAPLDTQWWHTFGDDQLDRLIELALATSPSLKIAQIRLTRAQAAVEARAAASDPQLLAALDVTHQQYTAHGAVPPPLAGSVRDSAAVQITGSWELDFFGKNEAALQAALGSARAAQADAAAARMLLASKVLSSYVQLARLHDQLAVARHLLAQREQSLHLIQARVDAGLDTRLELLQGEAALPDARAQIEGLQEQAQLAQHAIQALIGEPANAPPILVPSLSALRPAAVAATLPSDLLGRRADIAAARWRVEAAGADVRSARAQFYPSINLVGFAGLSSIGLDRLLSAGSEQWGLGPALRLPIFDGGRLRANLRGRTADLDAAVESYNLAVIEAVREVGDQLASATSISRQQHEQRAAQDLADHAYALARQRYAAGLGNYLQVLAAEAALLQQRRQGVDLAARVLDNQVALMRALGGGYRDALPAETAKPVKTVY